MMNICLHFTPCLTCVDPDPDQFWEYGHGSKSGSTKFLNTDPDPQHCIKMYKYTDLSMAKCSFSSFWNGMRAVAIMACFVLAKIINCYQMYRNIMTTALEEHRYCTPRKICRIIRESCTRFVDTSCGVGVNP